MNADKLNKRVTFQTNTPTVNSIGEYVDTYADTFTVWAAVEPLTGRLLFEAQQASSQVQGRVRIRYRTGVTSSMRMSYDTRYLKILSIINPKEANEELQVLYKEWLD